MAPIISLMFYLLFNFFVNFKVVTTEHTNTEVRKAHNECLVYSHLPVEVIKQRGH